MRNNIGFINPTHQGWKLRKLAGSRETVANPYPEGTNAYSEFVLGMSRFEWRENYLGEPLNNRKQQ